MVLGRILLLCGIASSLSFLTSCAGGGSAQESTLAATGSVGYLFFRNIDCTRDDGVNILNRLQVRVTSAYKTYTEPGCSDVLTSDMPIGGTSVVHVNRTATQSGSFLQEGAFCYYHYYPTGIFVGPKHSFDANTLSIEIDCKKNGLICECNETKRSATD
jgi:hypothetical protein